MIRRISGMNLANLKAASGSISRGGSDYMKKIRIWVKPFAEKLAGTRFIQKTNLEFAEQRCWYTKPNPPMERASIPILPGLAHIFMTQNIQGIIFTSGVTKEIIEKVLLAGLDWNVNKIKTDLKGYAKMKITKSSRGSWIFISPLPRRRTM
jgi:hypothetical protein